MLTQRRLWRLSVGAGAGYSLVAAGSGDNDPTLFAVVGAQFDIGSGWSIQPELRARAVDPWVGTVSSFDLGMRKNLGR